MRNLEDFLTSTDGHKIGYYRWIPDSPVIRGVIQISHGMAEHAGRYRNLAEHFCAQGYAVVAHDHRGHGRSIANGQTGHYADRDGWDKVAADLLFMANQIKSWHPDVPHFLFAHSMGSFISLQCLIAHRPPFHGVILSGSNYGAPLKYLAAAAIARAEKLRLGARSASRLLDQLSFGSFNHRFAPNRTEFDWLSRDPAEVDNYIKDPWCGFICTTATWIAMLDGLRRIFTSASFSRINPNLPIYLISGDKDPVGEFGKGVKRLERHLREAGVRDLSCTLYPDGRHEMLNEINRQQVLNDLSSWVTAHTP
ncbi:alpha/beta hydrolase [Hahella sp. CR1]|uniref:alpha/beta hydrolase n=1 Tax=Hahella sp. CR1 TaxID=2992807 RepID=UPI002441D298|nr:alpha/beta hydrolase [Hahella sp. CR1]MDG9667932.1 alpha/beta hydrolase [Hahella sp. CR1]